MVMKIDYPMVKILRINEDEKHGTFGVMVIQEVPFCVTLEPCDELNASFISSIPAQQYWCHKYHSAKYGDTFRVLNVPARDSILFHPGNRVIDTEGCILVAQYWGKLRGDRAVLNSGGTFRKFMDVMAPYEVFHLTIKEYY